MSEKNSVDKLPEVAQSVFTFCKKCDGDHYHRVLAHKTETSAKVECETCSAKSTYKIGKKKAQKKTTRKRKKSASPEAIWEGLEGDYKDAPKLAYTPKDNFDQGIRLDHAQFGLGYVTFSNQRRIEVVFKDGPRQLIHNLTKS